MNAEMEYEMLDKGGTHFQKPSLLFGLVEKLAERREIDKKEYCNLARDHCSFSPASNYGITDAVIQFVANDIIGMVTMAAYKNGLRADMSNYAVRLKEVLENYATKR